MITWDPSTDVVGSFRDQLERSGDITAAELLRVDQFLADVDAADTLRKKRAAAAYGYYVISRLNADTQGGLIDAIKQLSDALDAESRG